MVMTSCCVDRCQELVILETYTAKGDDFMLPDFLAIDHEITEDPYYSMYNLSKRPDAAVAKQRVRSISEGDRKDGASKPPKRVIARKRDEASVERCNGISAAATVSTAVTNGHRQSSAS